jgi:hypothetical protein
MLRKEEHIFVLNMITNSENKVSLIALEIDEFTSISASTVYLTMRL